MDETLTQKQRVAVEALEGAQRAGVPLSDYAKAKGLELRRCMTRLRRCAGEGPCRGRTRRASAGARAALSQSG